MKKLRIILAAALMMGASTMFTACDGTFTDDDVYGPNGNGNGNNNNNNNNDNYDDNIPGVVESFSVDLNYNSVNPSSVGGFDADRKVAVANNNSGADMVLCWQNNYGYVITQPKSPLLNQLYEANNKSYNNTNTCTIQNLGQANISKYDDKATLRDMSVSSGSIPNLQGSNIVQVEPGDVIAFKTNQGAKGVAKISNLSKVSKKVTLTGYVYYPSSSSK